MSNGYNLSIENLYIKEIKKFDILNRDEEIELFKNVKNGCEDSKSKLVNSNLRLVLKYANKYKWSNIDILDLIQEGSLGLIKAIETFDLEKGYKFSTHATWRIKRSISESIPKQYKSIRMPENIFNNIKKVKDAIKILHEENGHQPNIKSVVMKAGISEYNVKNAIRLMQNDIHLDKLVYEDNDITIKDTIEDKNTISPYQEALNNSLNNKLDTLFDNLNDRESEILKLRYGLNLSEPKTLKEVGDLIGVTSEYVRQIQDKAIIKLRCMDGIEKLEEYLYA